MLSFTSFLRTSCITSCFLVVLFLPMPTRAIATDALVATLGAGGWTTTADDDDSTTEMLSYASVAQMVSQGGDNMGLLTLLLGVAEWGISDPPGGLCDPTGNNWAGRSGTNGRQLMDYKAGGFGIGHFDTVQLTDIYATHGAPPGLSGDWLTQSYDWMRCRGIGSSTGNCATFNPTGVSDTTAWNLWQDWAVTLLRQQVPQRQLLERWIETHWYPAISNTSNQLGKTIVNSAISDKNTAQAAQWAQLPVAQQLENFRNNTANGSRTVGFMLRPLAVYEYAKEGSVDCTELTSIAEGLGLVDRVIDENNIVVSYPNLQVNIPGLTFREATPESLTRSEAGGRKYLQIPFLAEYIAAVYRYAVGVITIIAGLMLVVGGLLYMTSGASGNTALAKKLSVGSVVSMILAISSYLILYVINPDLVRLRPIEVVYVEGIEEEEDIDPINGSGQWPDGVEPPPGALPIDFNGNPVPEFLGPYDPTLELCSAAGMLDTITKLDSLNICVGACHCAYTSSHILRYIGCGIDYSGGANTLTVNARNLGWEEIASEDVDTSDARLFGLLSKKCRTKDSICHVGVYAGSGIQFDSGGGGSLYRQRVGHTCPRQRQFWFLDPLVDGKNCRDCSLIPRHAPISGNYGSAHFNSLHPETKVLGTNAGTSCQGTQIWVTRPYAPDTWDYLYVPQTYRGCPPGTSC